jgi:hypothetical protein
MSVPEPPPELEDAQRDAFERLRECEKTIASRFADPYGSDNHAYERALKTDPERNTLYRIFDAARTAHLKWRRENDPSRCRARWYTGMITPPGPEGPPDGARCALPKGHDGHHDFITHALKRGWKLPPHLALSDPKPVISANTDNKAEKARKLREREIAALQKCTCLYPLERYSNGHGHAPKCPAANRNTPGLGVGEDNNE